MKQRMHKNVNDNPTEGYGTYFWAFSSWPRLSGKKEKRTLKRKKEMCFTFAKTSMKDIERHIKIIYIGYIFENAMQCVLKSLFFVCVCVQQVLRVPLRREGKKDKRQQEGGKGGEGG